MEKLLEFEDLSKENNYIIPDPLRGPEKGYAEGCVLLDVEAIVRDLLRCLPYYRSRLNNSERTGKPFTLPEIESMAWTMAQIESDMINELTSGFYGKGILDKGGVNKDLEFRLETWGAADIDTLADQFVDFVNDEGEDHLEEEEYEIA